MSEAESTSRENTKIGTSDNDLSHSLSRLEGQSSQTITEAVAVDARSDSSSVYSSGVESVDEDAYGSKDIVASPEREAPKPQAYEGIEDEVATAPSQSASKDESYPQEIVPQPRDRETAQAY